MTAWLLAILAILIASPSAWADCTLPGTAVCNGVSCAGQTRPEGALQYNTEHKVVQYCDGTVWQVSQGVGPNCLAGDSVILTSSGWWCGNAGGFTGFTDLAGQSLSSLVSSNILQVARPGTSTVTISGEGSPQYRVCQDSGCTSVIQTWGSTAGTVNEGEFLQLRLTTSGSNAVTRTAVVDVSGTSDEWKVATGHDTLPDPMSFAMSLSQPGSTVVQSGIVQVTGITTAVSTSISGGGSPQYRTCSDAACSTEIQTWTSGAATVSNNQYLQLRATTPASGTISVVINAGTGSGTWNVSTNGKGYLVMSSGSSTGNLGGRSGADATCLSNLSAGAWLEKANATLDAAHVFSFLCDGSGCNNLQASTIYQFARSGSGTTGGAFFITNGSGQGPGNSSAWDTATTFNTTSRFWSSRAAGSATLWSTAGQANHCNNWSDGTISFNGVRGDPTDTDDRRWNDSTEACNTTRQLVCIVNP